jgi:hypothetical protein
MKNRITMIVSTTVALLLACFAFSPQTQAACGSPDPGCPTGNLAEGYLALAGLTIGAYNTGIGASALPSLTAGNFNTGVGASTLLTTTTGSEDTAAGAAALASNVSGFGNTAVGAFALFKSNVTGLTIGLNTAVGDRALFSATTAPWNVAVGANAIRDNISGFGNVGVGLNALLHTTGNANTAVGQGAGSDVVAGSGNVYVGAGVNGFAGSTNTTRIRNIGSTPIVGGITVVIDGTSPSGDSLLGYASSSRRYKEDIKPMDKASETLFALKPVTFQGKGDRAHVKHYGLIAEEVATVSPHLAVYNPQGQPETVRYEAVNAMLLNEFLKEHKKVQNLEATVATLAATVKEQATQIQKVSAQLEMSKPAPHVVANKQ